MTVEDFTAVAQALDPAGRLLRADALEGGLSARMTRLEIARVGGTVRRVVVRQPGTPGADSAAALCSEFALLQHLAAQQRPVAQPLRLDASGMHLSSPYLVTAFVDGACDFAPRDLDSWLSAAALELNAIHQTPTPNLQLPLVSDQLRAKLDTPPPVLDRSFDEARVRAALREALPNLQSGGRTLLHGDFWPGNILWREGRIAAVIDWEDAMLGHPLCDLAITRLDLLWAFGTAAMHRFTHLCTRDAHDPQALAAWDLYASLRPAGRFAEWAEGWHRYGRTDVTETSLRAAHGNFVREAFDVLMQ